jgi:hypothetical protein
VNPIVDSPELLSVQRYARELRPQLSPTVFQPTPEASQLPSIGHHRGARLFVVLGAPPWWLALGCAIVAGHS